MEAAARALDPPPGILFAPEDEVAVGYYLIPRLLGWQLPVDGLVLEDDPLSSPPWELLGRNGRKEDAFFFAKGQARCGKGTRQKRTCSGGGWWEGQKTSPEGDKLRVPGGGGQEAAWRKMVLNFHGGGGGKKGSTGWVMHEYAVTAPEDLARSPLRLYHIRLSSYGRKQISGMEVPRVLGLPPGFLFAPEDGDVVAHYLLPRILGQPLPLDGLILDDDPLSAMPWELLERNGCKDDAFFFALGQAKNSKGSRQKRTCVGGGFWNGERTCADGEKLHVPGPEGGAEVVWRKKAFSYQEGGSEKGSTGWVMHEYAITAPDHLAESQLMLYRIRFSGHGKKRKRGEADSMAEEAAPPAARRRVAEDALFDTSTSQDICSSTTVMMDQAGINCINDADQLTAAAQAVIPANQDLNPSITVHTPLDFGSGDNFDTDGFLRSLGLLPPLTNPCVLPAVTDPGAYLQADATSSSFFYQTVAAAPPYDGVGVGLAPQYNAPAMHHGCMEPADSLFYTMPNQSYAAC